MSQPHRQGTLPDGTDWFLFMSSQRGGQQVSPGVPLVILRGWSDEDLCLTCGLRSMHRVWKALQTCSNWCEVPLCVEAVRWSRVPEGFEL